MLWLKFECFNFRVMNCNIVHSAGVVLGNYQLINGHEFKKIQNHIFTKFAPSGNVKSIEVLSSRDDSCLLLQNFGAAG